MYDILQLNKKTVADLKIIAKDMGVKTPAKYKKEDLIYKILDQQAIAPAKKPEQKREADTATKTTAYPKREKKAESISAENSKTSQLSIDTETDVKEKKISYPKKPVSERVINVPGGPNPSR